MTTEQTPKTTKIRVEISLDVDLDAYRAEYGDPTLSAADIRDSIRSSILSASLTDGVVVPAGIILDGTVRA